MQDPVTHITDHQYQISVSHFVDSKTNSQSEWVRDDLNLNRLAPEDFIVFSRVTASTLSGNPFGQGGPAFDENYKQFTVLIKNRLYQMEEVKIHDEKNKQLLEIHYIISSPVERVQGVSRADEQVLGTLSEREIEVLTLMAQGYSMSKIANMLFLSPYTIDSHRLNLCKKLEVRRTTELAVWAYKLGLLDPHDHLSMSMS